MKRSDFNSVPLSEAANVIRGVSYSSGEAISVEKKGYLPVLRAGNIQSDLILNDGLVWVPESKVSSKQKILKNDVIMCTSSGSASIVGKTARANQDWMGSFGAFCAGLRANEKTTDPAYLFHYLNTPIFKAWTQRSLGANIKNIRKSELEAHQIPLPDIREQKRIAAILDKADEIRRKRQQAIRFANEFLRSVFLDMFGDPVKNPNGWDEIDLDQLAEIRSGVTKGRKFHGRPTIKLPYMRVANVQDGRIDLTDIQKIEILEGEVDRFSLKPGDLLLTEGGDPDKLGRGAVWHGEVSPCVHQNHIFAVRPDLKIVHPEFLSTQIGSQRGKRYFLKVGKQTTGIATINKTVLSAFPTLAPPIQLQQEYVDIVEKIHKYKKKLGELNLLGTELFQSTSQYAFRGEL